MIGGGAIVCAGIEFGGRRIYFNDKNALLPILTRSGEIEWAIWGKPHSVDDKYGPRGSSVSRDLLLSGAWKRWKPRPVKIPASAFMEIGEDGNEVWLPIDDRLVIQGAAIEVPNSIHTLTLGTSYVRVYIVTVPEVGEVAEVYDRMPRLITNPLAI